MLKIDVFCHVFPKKYRDAVLKKAGGSYSFALSESIITLYDLDARFRIMDKFPEVLQVLTSTYPPVERIAGPEDALDLAKIANDEMAELVLRYPDRFVAAVANIPMNNIEGAVEEINRAINELNFRGAQVYTSVNGEPLDLPKFWPIYEKMEEFNLPIFIHPYREPNVQDYPTEDGTRYGLNSSLGYPFETSIAMARLVYGGVLEKFPRLKFVTHHAGGMIPFFSDRMKKFFYTNQMRSKRWRSSLTRQPLDYFRMFYADTGISGYTPALMCAFDFFGADHLLFATDMPFDSQLGELHNRETIRSIEAMDISAKDRNKIYEDNAKELLRLPL